MPSSVIRRIRPPAGPPGAQPPTPPADEPTDDEDEAYLTAAGADRSGLRRWLGAAWLALPLAVIVAVVSSTIGGSGGIGTGGSQKSAPGSNLPSVLVAVGWEQTGSGQQWSVQVGPGTGLTARSTLSLDTRVARVEVGPAGQVAAVDDDGDLHLLPGSTTLKGHIQAASFSPDGRFLAICRAKSWPPMLTIVSLTDPGGALWPGVPGCDPEWSADSSYVAYRVPSDTLGPGVFAADSFGVLDVGIYARYVLPGAWPVAWAPAPAYASTPLTVISAERDSVTLMDPTGDLRRTLVTAETLRGLTGGHAFGPLEMLAWSPDGQRLAAGSAAGATGFGLPGVAVLDPETGNGTFVGGGYDPVSLTWSAGQELMAEFTGPMGPLTRLVPKDAPFVELLDIGQASWSPDGHWILARTKGGWVAIDASAPEKRLDVGQSSQWTLAIWCCPPVPVARLGT